MEFQVGNATVGTIIGNGNYSAPLGLPTPNNITVTATSIADSTQSGNAAITLQNPAPVLTSVTPAFRHRGRFHSYRERHRLCNGAVVNFGSMALATTFVSSTQLTATGTATASQAGNVLVT